MKKPKRPRTKPHTLSPDATESAVEELVILITRDVSEPLLIRAACDRHNVDETNARKLLAAARRKLTLAARYHRDREIGVAYKRLNALFASSLQTSQQQVALATQKELNKLLGLYDSPEIATQDNSLASSNAEAAAIRDHLVPLGLGAESTPLVEVVRLAALRLMELIPDE